MNTKLDTETDRHAVDDLRQALQGLLLLERTMTDWSEAVCATRAASRNAGWADAAANITEATIWADAAATQAAYAAAYAADEAAGENND